MQGSRQGFRVLMPEDGVTCHQEGTPDVWLNERMEEEEDAV